MARSRRTAQAEPTAASGITTRFSFHSAPIFASVALDDKAREALLQKIGALWNEKRVVIPLAAVGSAWAVRRDRATLRVGRSDEETYAWDVVPVAR